MKNGLVSATTISSSQSLLQQGLVGEEAPETGLFDFTSYLLGLQESSTDLMKPEGALDLPTTGFLQEIENTENPLLKALDKANREMWNPLFPVQNDGMPALNAVPQMQVLAPSQDQQPKKLLEISPGLDQLSGLEEMESNSQKEGAKAPASEKVTEFLALDSLQKSDDRETIDPEIASEDYSPQIKEQLKNAEPLNAEVKMQKTTIKEKPSEDNTPVEQTQMSRNENVIRENNKKEIDESKSKSVNQLGQYHMSSSELQAKMGPVPASPSFSEVLAPAQNQSHSVPEVFQRVESMIHDGGGTMTVLLSPAELGQVEIKIHARGKQIDIQVKSENDFAKQAIESGVDDLRSSMEVKDLQLAKFEVHVGDMGHMGFEKDRWANQMAQGDGSNQSQSQQSQKSRDEGNGNRSARYQNVSDLIEAPRFNPSALRTGGVDRGRLDIRV